jgi:hypothetical protein
VQKRGLSPFSSLYRDGVPAASLEAGDLVLRRALDEGERIDKTLRVFRRAVAADGDPAPAAMQ